MPPFYVAAAVGARGGTFTYNGFIGRLLQWRESTPPRLDKLTLAPLDGSHLTQESIPRRRLSIRTIVEATPVAARIEDGRLGGFDPLMDAYDSFMQSMAKRGEFPLTLSLEPDRYIMAKATRWDKRLRRADRFWQAARVSFDCYDPLWYSTEEFVSPFVTLLTANYTIAGTATSRPRFVLTYEEPTSGFTLTDFNSFKEFEYSYTPPAGQNVTIEVDMLNRRVSNTRVFENPMQHASLTKSSFFEQEPGPQQVDISWKTVTPSGAPNAATVFWRDRWV